MISSFRVFLGQSTVDLCLKSVGSLDGYINFLSLNNLQSNTQIPEIAIYDTNSVINKVITKNNYSTGSGLLISANGLLDNDGTPLLDNDGTQLFDNG